VDVDDEPAADFEGKKGEDATVAHRHDAAIVAWGGEERGRRVWPDEQHRLSGDFVAAGHHEGSGYALAAAARVGVEQGQERGDVARRAGVDELVGDESLLGVAAVVSFEAGLRADRSAGAAGELPAGGGRPPDDLGDFGPFGFERGVRVRDA
jgi:hypothetical protein